MSTSRNSTAAPNKAEGSFLQGLQLARMSQQEEVPPQTVHSCPGPTGHLNIAAGRRNTTA
jgi:hypothetical protein